MKDYIKPSIEYIELRLEESLAGLGSGSSIIDITRTINTFEPMSFSDNGLYFWLKILRK